MIHKITLKFKILNYFYFFNESIFSRSPLVEEMKPNKNKEEIKLINF